MTSKLTGPGALQQLRQFLGAQRRQPRRAARSGIVAHMACAVATAAGLPHGFGTLELAHGGLASP
ncbi:MAG TPA: hypothetical protein VK679_08055, partial [Gemmatimonadaceae bacterium]|nr:hypothetical protein [Gemmatimonadaceae bacterium]